MESTSQGAAPTSEQKGVEMSELQSQDHQSSTVDADTVAGAENPDSSKATTSHLDVEDDTTTANRPRVVSEALGPASDSPIAPPSSAADRGPTLSITLMLTTGARHPYKIDEKYLKNRKVTEGALDADGSFDPREISGYKLKELIWTDWRQEWEPRPASPSSIRLIILGRLVEDKAALKANVVHMTVKPADFLEDDEATGGKGTGKGHSIRGRDGEERGAGCRCVIL